MYWGLFKGHFKKEEFNSTLKGPVNNSFRELIISDKQDLYKESDPYMLKHSNL